MDKLISFAKKCYFIAVFSLFAVLTARAIHFSPLSGDDYLFAVKASDGFLQTVAYGAKYLGEGIAASFIRTSLTALPEIVWHAICTVCLVFSCVAVALAASRGASFESEDDCPASFGAAVGDGRFGAALVFSSAAFSLLPTTVLRDAVFCISGTVHYVIPCSLILLFYLLIDRAVENKATGAWYLPVLAVVCSLLSWQAALAAAVIALWYIVKSIRRRGFRVSYAFSLAAPLVIFAALFVLSDIPRFPSGVSKLWAIRSFLGETFSDEGFSAVLLALSITVCVRAFTKEVLPSLRSKEDLSPRFIFNVALCFSSAANVLVLFIHSSLVPDITVSGPLTVTVGAVNLVLIAASYLFDLIDKKGDAPVLFALAALVCTAATLPTYSFGGASFYLPLTLSFVLLCTEFIRIRKLRAALITVCAFGAYFAAHACLTKGKVIIAAAIIIVSFIIELSPVIRRIRITEILCCALALLTLWGIGNGYAKASLIVAENESRIEEFNSDPKPFVILRSGEADSLGFPDSSLDAGQLAYYRKYHALADDVNIVFISKDHPTIPDNIGDLNGDGKINSKDKLLLMKYLEG